MGLGDTINLVGPLSPFQPNINLFKSYQVVILLNQKHLYFKIINNLPTTYYNFLFIEKCFKHVKKKSILGTKMGHWPCHFALSLNPDFSLQL